MAFVRSDDVRQTAQKMKHIALTLFVFKYFRLSFKIKERINDEEEEEDGKKTFNQYVRFFGGTRVCGACVCDDILVIKAKIKKVGKKNGKQI